MYLLLTAQIEESTCKMWEDMSRWAVYLPLDKHITKRYVLHLEHLLIHFDFCSGLYSKNISFDLGGTLVAGQWIIAFVDAHL